MWRTAAASETSGRPNRHFRRGLSEGGRRENASPEGWKTHRNPTVTETTIRHSEQIRAGQGTSNSVGTRRISSECRSQPPSRPRGSLNEAQSRSRQLTDFSMERQLCLLLGVPLRLHLTPPFLWILFVHLPHVLGRLRMFLHDVRRHSLDHFVPGVGGHLLVAGAAQFSAGHRFQCRLLVPDNNGDIRLIPGRSAVGQRPSPSSETIGRTEMVQRDNPE
jgi:hypothetical protein